MSIVFFVWFDPSCHLPETRLIDLSAYGICGDEEQKIDNRVENTHGPAKTVIVLEETSSIHEGWNHVGSLINNRVVQKENFLETDTHHTPHT